MRAICSIIILGLLVFQSCKKDPVVTTPSGDGLIINEFLASNLACCSDENGDFDDWVEIYNPGATEVDIAGMFLSDMAGDLTPYEIPSTDPSITTIPSKGYLTLWFDKEMDQGLLHIDLKLAKDGETIILLDKDKNTVLDQYTYGPQTTDVSEGRQGDEWVNFDNPSPGSVNR